MMHSNKMVCCLKASGKVLRETQTPDETQVFLPFGQEYSILLKNLNSKRALVNVTIDGESVVDGSLVVPANGEFELERFVKDMNKGNRFKFIQRTEAIENHRGIKIDDGLIRVSFKYEKLVPMYNTLGFSPYICKGIDNITLTNYTTTSYDSSTPVSLQSIQCSAQLTASVNSAGVTAPGSISNQQFRTVSSFLTEDEEFVIVLHLLGETPQGKVVKAPVTVKHRQKCTMCGHKNRAPAKFCVECGTALTVI